MTVRSVLVVATTIVMTLAGMTLAAGPASAAATVTVNASWDGSSGSAISFSQNPVSINLGDSVAFAFSSSDGKSHLDITTDASCATTPLAEVVSGQTATLTPAASTTYDVIAFNLSQTAQSTCTAVKVTVGKTADVATDGVTCFTVTGKITFAAGLHDPGASTPVVANAKGTMGGCNDRTNSAVHMFKGTFAQTFTVPTLDCATLFSVPNQVNLTAGTSTFTWTPAAGQDFAPKTTVGTATKRIATGTPFAWGAGPASGLGIANTTPWTRLAIGSNNLVGMFTGQASDGTYIAYLQQDLGNIFNQCASTNGLTSISLGVGFFVT